jgi:hypothetical protein
MIQSPEWTRPIINTTYPPENEILFEKWFSHHYLGDVSEREYLPIHYTAYQVNNNYGQDKAAMQKLQDYVDTLPNNKKYHTICQYDNGVGVDWKGKDVLEFNMSLNGENMYPLPLLCQPHSFDFAEEPKEYIANFIGNKTHPIRNQLEQLQNKEGYYISFQQHSIEDYCRKIYKSIFTLCPRGYGVNSFRINEAMQYGSIPIYISDEFIHPHNIPFNTYGFTIADGVDVFEYISSITPLQIYEKQERLKEYYEKLYTYQANFDLIIEHLRNET